MLKEKLRKHLKFLKYISIILIVLGGITLGYANYLAYSTEEYSQALIVILFAVGFCIVSAAIALIAIFTGERSVGSRKNNGNKTQMQEVQVDGR